MIIRLKPTITETEYERLIHYFTEKDLPSKISAERRFKSLVLSAIHPNCKTETSLR